MRGINNINRGFESMLRPRRVPKFNPKLFEFRLNLWKYTILFSVENRSKSK